MSNAEVNGFFIKIINTNKNKQDKTIQGCLGSVINLRNKLDQSDRTLTVNLNET